jgi:predicted DNA-binding transcriptional regulator YafY
MASKLRGHKALEQVELMLERTQNGLTSTDISRELGCSAATAWRYIRIIEEDRPLIQTGRDRYRLDPLQGIRNVRLHPTEALTIYLALRRFIRQTSKAPVFMIHALQKVIPALRRTDLIESLLEGARILNSERSANADDERIWQVLIQGWLQSQVIRIEYQGLKDLHPKEHIIEPYLFEPMPFGDGNYLIAWSRTRAEMRTFKPDRIHRAILTSESFVPRDIPIDELLLHAMGIWYGDDLHEVELIFSPRVARRLQESVMLRTEQKVLLPDGSLRWTAKISGLLEIVWWVRSWGPDVEVVGPAALRERVIDELKQTLAQYE